MKGGMNLSPYSEGEIRPWQISTGENWDLIHPWIWCSKGE